MALPLVPHEEAEEETPCVGSTTSGGRLRSIWTYRSTIGSERKLAEKDEFRNGRGRRCLENWKPTMLNCRRLKSCGQVHEYMWHEGGLMRLKDYAPKPRLYLWRTVEVMLEELRKIYPAKARLASMELQKGTTVGNAEEWR